MTQSASAEEMLPLDSLFGGRYRLERCLGSGAMGTVYAARDIGDGRALALKIIRREHTANQAAVARFQREGRLVSEIRHPNIVEVFAVDQADGRWFIAMELLEGTNLTARIGRGQVYRPDEAVPVLRGILRALEGAHERKIVHRDIKPENVFVVRGGEGAPPQVKVLDFGVAKVVGLSAQDQLTRSGTVLGTPEFMAPEQATGTSVDHRSDLYSVACVAYAMICGRPPFVDNWPLRVLMKQAYEPYEPPSRLRPALPGAAAVDRFMERALQKKPEDRFQSAREMGTALEALADTPPLVTA
jgi:serine/threonine-protein kinase